MPPGVVIRDEIRGRPDGGNRPQASQYPRPSRCPLSHIRSHTSAGRKKRGELEKKARRLEPGDKVQQKRLNNDCHTGDEGNSRQQSCELRTAVNGGERRERAVTKIKAGTGSVTGGGEGINWQQTEAILHNNKFEYKLTGILSETANSTSCNNSNRLTHNRSEVEASPKGSTSRDRNITKHGDSDPPTTCAGDNMQFEANSHMHTGQDFHNRAEYDDCASFESDAERGTVAYNATEGQQETNYGGAIQVYNLHAGKCVDKAVSCYKIIISYSRVKGNKHPCNDDLEVSIQHFAAIFDRLPVIDLTVTFLKTIFTIPSVIKHHPTRCLEYLASPEQESQFGYESHLNGGVMVNGRTLISNISVVLMGSLRGDKTSSSCDYGGFGSLRSKSGFEQFRDTHNKATFATLRENRHANYARSSYRAEIVGASKLAGVYSEQDAAHKPLDHKQAPLGMNYGTANDWKSMAGHVSTVLPENVTPITKSDGYNKPTYPVLIGNYVRVYMTKLFAMLPRHSKFMVKERLPGMSRVKLTLKCSFPLESHDVVNEDMSSKTEAEKYGKPVYFRENCRSPGYVIYTCDGNFSGTIKYPLPSGKATDSKIGKGGNGFVFTIYHQRKKYAAKKTVYRSNEVNVHAALRHENVLPLVAVLMGERHEHHSSKFYCFHFMPVMDCDLRQILSTREVGCLKHFYTNCSKEPGRWEIGFNNIKFIFGETLKALIYLHDNGYVHRDVKASNIMIKMQCRCQPLSCRCSSKFQVKLGDFDSAGTVPGLGIKEPTDQMIKFASILPLGTPGYRAPEVSMHITLSGPYETLYTFAVDMWSFGCLCLNICIGKTAALKQREEASLLLSRTHPCSKELWEKTTKIKELERAKPFIHEKALVNLVRSCLQVDGGERPSARDALKVFKLN